MKVIGDAEPLGLCGSGLVDAVTGLVRAACLTPPGGSSARSRPGRWRRGWRTG